MGGTMITGVSKLDSYPTDTGKKEVKKVLGKDDFLRLLVTQMQFQNPLEPMEHTEFTAQLAQFSSLDQLFAINDGLKVLSETQNGINRMQSVNFMGKEVKASGNKVYMEKDKPSTTIGYYLNKDVAGITVHVYDKDGKGIRTIEIGPQNVGSQRVVWDGRDNSGNVVSPGEYTFSVVAEDLEGKKSEVLTNIIGIVTGISFEESIPYLMVGGIRVPVTHVTEVKEVAK